MQTHTGIQAHKHTSTQVHKQTRSMARVAQLLRFIRHNTRVHDTHTNSLCAEIGTHTHGVSPQANEEAASC
jgi:hypothetical protein